MSKCVALVDDHQMVLEGLANLIAAEMPGVETYTCNDPLEFLETLTAEHSYSLVVTDLFMLKMNGLAFASAIRDRDAELPVLLLSGVEDELPQETVLSSGAKGFVSKKVGQKALFDGITATLDGKFYLNGTVQELSAFNSADRQFGTARLNGVDYHHPKLSDRQLEILKLIADGASNKDISNQLVISENTVKSHIKLLFSELGVNKRAACVRQARVYGII